jgi:hypothetical protein
MSSTVQSEGRAFQFDRRGLERLSFYPVRNEIIMAIYIKDKFICLSISFNDGLNFGNDERLLKLAGELRDLQILTRSNQFVMGILESYAGTDHKRAVAGWLFPEEKRFRFKECTETEIQGRIINISLGFREMEPGKYESVDYVFHLNQDGKVVMSATGHPCVLV